MSRGGRGGFGGRGGGASGGRAGGMPQSVMNMGMTISALGGNTGKDPTDDFQIVRGGMGMYPPYEALPQVQPASEEETKILEKTRNLGLFMRNNKYRIVEGNKEKKTEDHYSDKYHSSQAKDIHSLNAEELCMKKAFFPDQVWAGYFEPQKKMQAKRIQKKKRGVDDIDAGDEDGDDKGSQGSGDEDEENYDMASDDEDEEGDYGHQYFDNGEGDDMDDLGGGGVGGGDDE